MDAANAKREIALIGAPVEDGAGRRGCAMGPAAYRTAGIVEALSGLGHRVRDLGDVAPRPAPDATCGNPAVKNLEAVAGWTRALREAGRDAAASGAIPVWLGGDHSLSLGTVAAQAEAARAAGRPLFVLWLDAHADFNTLETTESGNLHGAPLAFLCGQPGGEILLGGPLRAPVAAENVCILGLRSVDAPERALLAREGLAAHDMRAIDEQGVAALLAPFVARAAEAGAWLHVSLDVDFLDPGVAPAVGTTVPGGATFREAHLVMELLHDSSLVRSLDLVELNPFLDERGRTATLMVDLAASLFGRRVLDRPTRSF